MKITVIGHPNSRRPRVETDLLGDIHVYVREPPLAGRANQAIIDSLAQHFQVKPNRIFLVGGSTSRKKVFDIVA